MSVHQINCCLADCLEAKTHLIPCKIKQTCDAKVDQYFEPTVNHKEGDKEGDKEVLTSSFRGRPLQGRKIHLDNNCFGVVLTQNKSHFKVEKQFKQFTYWNWDKTPSTNDLVPQSLQWLRVANAIHKPLTSADINQVNN